MEIELTYLLDSKALGYKLFFVKALTIMEISDYNKTINCN